MTRLKCCTICFGVILPLLLPVSGQAFNFGFTPPNQGQQPPPGGYRYRPQPPSNSRGIPPSYQQPGYQQPGYQQPGGYQPTTPYGYGQQRQQPQFRPSLELGLSDSSPYVKENIILTLRVVSSVNLKTVDPILPQNQSATFLKIKGPTAHSRAGSGGQRQIVNELVYLVTPLRPGSVELPISATVESAGNGYGGRTVTLEAAQPLRLDIRPAQPGVNPWLPLEQLALTSNIDAPVDVEPGKPVSLVLKLSAAGTTGSQLPSMEKLLRSPDFRVYREKTETEGGLSQNGRHIMGTRTEYYTLVPQNGGELRLPSARVGWFNVNTGTVEHTSLPIRTLDASGSSGGLGRFFGGVGEGTLFPAGYASVFWMPLLGIFLLLTGYWIGVWYKGPSATQGKPAPLAPLAAATRSVLSRLRSHSRGAFGRLSLRPYWNRVMVRAANLLPTSVRFWFWVRCANDEKDPALWCKTLKFLSWRQLALSPYAPLPEMAEKIIQFQPGANPNQVRKLFKALDGVIYGNDVIDFDQWKREFSMQVRPGLSVLFTGSKGRRRTESRLPELNPTET